jgi:hypothetical protein
MLSRHLQAPTRAAVTTALNVVSYLANTPALGIQYKHGNSNTVRISAYTDASFAPDEFGRRSRSGTIIMVNDSAVMWRSQLQRTVAHSTSEAEYRALSDGARDAMYVRQLLIELGVNISGPIVMHEDNQVAKRMAEEVATKRSKHIDVCYHHIRELVANGDIIISDCRTDNMLADLLTKPLPRDQFQVLRERFMAKGEC